MISHPRPNPQLYLKPKLLRLLKGNRMTIAIGMLCMDGLMMAADTRLTDPYTGATSDGIKVQAGKTGMAKYVASYSSENSDSGKSLCDSILANLESKNPEFLEEIDVIVEGSMKKWSRAFTLKDDRPSTQVILGAFIGDNQIGLFECCPPNTVTRKTFKDSNGYVASGMGQAITDPIFKMLFCDLVPAHDCLCRIAYLMHRAKLNYGAYCGGDTDVVFLKNGTPEPIWIERVDMKCAEYFGPKLDKGLSITTSAIFSPFDWDDQKKPIDLLREISQLGLAYQRFKFRAREGGHVF